MTDYLARVLRARRHARAHLPLSVPLWAQESFNSLERCPVPVVAAVHGSCVGAGVDLVSACDVATCSADACFCVKEVDLAIAADMGSLQRLPGLIGAGRTAELALTARTFHGPEAAAMGLVAQCAAHGGRDAALQSATAIATAIASKSPVAVMATKRVLLHKRCVISLH